MVVFCRKRFNYELLISVTYVFLTNTNAEWINQSAIHSRPVMSWSRRKEQIIKLTFNMWFGTRSDMSNSFEIINSYCIDERTMIRSIDWFIRLFWQIIHSCPQQPSIRPLILLLLLEGNRERNLVFRELMSFNTLNSELGFLRESSFFILDTRQNLSISQL